MNIFWSQLFVNMPVKNSNCISKSMPHLLSYDEWWDEPVFERREIFWRETTDNYHRCQNTQSQFCHTRLHSLSSCYSGNVDKSLLYRDIWVYQITIFNVICGFRFETNLKNLLCLANTSICHILFYDLRLRLYIHIFLVGENKLPAKGLKSVTNKREISSQ